MNDNNFSPVAPDDNKQEATAAETSVQPTVTPEPTIASEPIAAPTPAAKPKKKSKAPLLAAIIIVLLACGGVGAFLILNNGLNGPKNSTGQKNDEKKTEANKTLSELSMKNNSLSDFDLAFLKKNNNGKNVIYSPLSIKYALGMLSEGASGNSKKEIDTLIGDYEAKAYINSKNRSLANVLFVQNDQKKNIFDSYIGNIQTKYGASVVYDNFTNATNINKWISDKTLGIIQNMVKDDELASLDFMLVNALAIDMNWNYRLQCAYDEGNAQSIKDKYYDVSYHHEKYEAYISCVNSDRTSDFATVKFDGDKKVKAATIGASINRYDIIKELGEDKIRSTVKPKYEAWLKEQSDSDSETDVNTYLNEFIAEIKENYGMVDDSTDFKMFADDDVKVFAKDLKEYDGATLQYVGIMPKNQALKDFVKEANAEKITGYISKLYDIKKENFKDGVVTKVIGTIPFFKYGYDMDLYENLQSLGVKTVFSDKADLSKLTKVEGTQIIEAKHKADIEFSNDGIKAAAVTSMGGSGNAAAFDYLFDVPVETIDMTFDKPYIYLIRDKATGEVWFAGTVYEPSTKIELK